jgi:hypothetical protein
MADNDITLANSIFAEKVSQSNQVDTLTPLHITNLTLIILFHNTLQIENISFKLLRCNGNHGGQFKMVVGTKRTCRIKKLGSFSAGIETLSRLTWLATLF